MDDVRDTGPEGGPGTVEASRRGRERLEIVATLLLALAAVATAWAGYQATRWNGEQAKASGRTTALRIEATRAASLAETQTQVDVATFIQWVEATAGDDRELEDFYVDRFRPEFEVAFEAWIATDPLTNPEAPLTPFAMEEYQPSASVEAERIDQAADVSAAVVTRNIQRAANYVLGVVLFSVALFFAGMSTKLTSPNLRTATLVVGSVLFVGTAVWMATFPKSIAV